MKPLNVFLALLLVLALAFMAFFFAGSALSASVSHIAARASDYPEAFASIRNVVSSDAAPQVFSGETIENAVDYGLLDVNITLANRGIFDAEWLNITVNGASGDVAVYSLTGQGTDIPARSASAVNFKLITRTSESAPRSVTIQYYVFGVSRSITVDI